MKRKTLKLIACATVMALTLSVTACGSSDDASSASATGTEAEPSTDVEGKTEAESSTDNEEKTETESATDIEDKTEAEPVADNEEKTETETEPAADIEEKTETEDSTEAAAEYSTLEEYFASDPTTKADLENQAAIQSTDEITVSIDIKGNELIMVFQFSDSVEITSEQVDALEAALEEQGPAFALQAQALDTLIGQEDSCICTVRYTDSDGNILAEGSYTAADQ